LIALTIKTIFFWFSKIQEKYEADDEMGKLGCGHLYHIDCIKQWLMHTNSCPHETADFVFLLYILFVHPETDGS